jgi:hypothetical protein
VTFLLLFLPVCNYYSRKGPQLSGEKLNKASLSVQILEIFGKKAKEKIGHCDAQRRLFDTPLTVVFENIAFKPHTNYARDLFMVCFAQKVLF